MGSGSHLMAIVNAQNQGWKTNDLQFEIVNTIEGAVEALSNGKADYFMWEKFMTKPLVDNGTFRRVADCPTPWPCFVIAVRDEILEKHPQTIALILEIINTTTLEFKDIPSIDRTLAERYHQKKEDIQLWLSQTKWSQKNITSETLNKIQNQLFELSLIDKKSTFAEIVHCF
jgi:ABC-type nitrate/sulfonate/bicarbonate transport system substrate-binding protein